MIQPSPQQPLFPPFSATLGLDRPFQLGLFSLPLQPLSLPSRPAQSEFFSRHASPPPPPTRQISPPPPPTRQVSVPRQPLTPPASHSSAEDMDHNSGSVVSSSSHVDPYLEREVVRKDREIARKDAELAELRMRLQQAEAQSPGPRDTDLLAKEKILNQRLLQVDAREQALENKIKRSEEEAARLEAEKRDFERNRQSWAQEKDAQKEVVKNLIGQLAHAQSQML
ncbi:hypothetical protein BDZ89DRAFT_659845 [Hymenopellis radicata]|nr:hypothetical protein BDZ89DRAFT_659845 [Hymenopellis radicata]